MFVALIDLYNFECDHRVQFTSDEPKVFIYFTTNYHLKRLFKNQIIGKLMSLSNLTLNLDLELYF